MTFPRIFPFAVAAIMAFSVNNAFAAGLEGDYNINPVPVQTGMTFTFHPNVLMGPIGSNVRTTITYGGRVVYNKLAQHVGGIPLENKLEFTFPGDYQIPATRRTGPIVVWVAVEPRTILGETAIHPGNGTFTLVPHCAKEVGGAPPACGYATTEAWAILTPVH